MNHPDEIIQLIYSKYSKRHTIEHLEFEAKQMISLLRTDLVEPGHFNPGRWEHIAKTYKDLGMMEDDFDFDAFLYNPDPLPEDLTWLYLTLGILFLIAFLVTILALYIFRKNAQLRKEISERKVAEKAMKEMQAIVQRTSKLDSLGILAGGIAHDFNNLFTGVFGYIEMAQKISTDKKIAEYLSKSMQSLNQVRELTSQLITFSKGGKPVKEVRELFPFIKESAGFALSGTKVKCTFDYPEDLWKCEYDKGQIGQVIENIVVNASQADPNGTINIVCKNVEISEKEMPDLKKGKYVKILIKDFGPGMDPDIIDKVFDPFFTTKTGGHGLGLAISYSIIKQHFGSIELVSEKGEGTIFHIHLPACKESK
jgi:signal transduction histidine kinase